MNGLIDRMKSRFSALGDKTKHFFVCACMAFPLALFDPLLAVGVAMGAGLGKEYGDSKAKGSKWDWMDIAADAGGTAVWVVLATVIALIL